MLCQKWPKPDLGIIKGLPMPTSCRGSRARCRFGQKVKPRQPETSSSLFANAETWEPRCKSSQKEIEAMWGIAEMATVRGLERRLWPLHISASLFDVLWSYPSVPGCQKKARPPAD